jgi:hypothetical protein
MHMHNGSDAYIAYISVGFYIVSFLLNRAMREASNCENGQQIHTSTLFLYRYRQVYHISHAGEVATRVKFITHYEKI